MRSFVSKACRGGLIPAALTFLLAGTVRADEVTDWHEHMLAALGKAGTNPIVSTREAALVSSAVFDAVNGIERRYEPIHVSAEAPRGASKRAAAVQAAYAVLVSRFPTQAADLDAKRDASLAAIGDGGNGESVERGVEWGQEVAEAILDWRSTDGSSPTPSPYRGGNELGRWRPTPPGSLAGLVPQFATMTPWGIRSPDQFRASGPPALDSEQYAEEFNEVKAMGSAGSTLRTADQTDACRFWASTNPTYLWDRVALDLSAEGHNNLSENARLMARLNLAMADAIIACWDAKYSFEFWRPVTAIALADTDGNSETVKDAGWTPLLTTPPHPEYTSGHSSASSAAAAVLADAFGEDTEFTVQTQADPSWTRSFESFTAAVEEVADARVFAGIHFRAACVDGATTATSVAAYILENLMVRIHGKGQ